MNIEDVADICMETGVINEDLGKVKVVYMLKRMGSYVHFERFICHFADALIKYGRSQAEIEQENKASK